MPQGTQQAPVALKTPTTRGELEVLYMQREELKEQLNGLTKRRNQLDEQSRTLSGDAGRDHQLRIRDIDARAADIDRQMMRLDVAIANGRGQQLVEDRPQVLKQLASQQPAQAGTAVPPPPPPVPGFSQDAERAIILGGLAFSAVAIYAIFLAARRFFMKPSATSIEGQGRRLDQLQQSIDVIALEVERMSESQRFVAKVLNDKFPALGVGDAQPMSTKAKDAAKV